MKLVKIKPYRLFYLRILQSILIIIENLTVILTFGMFMVSLSLPLTVYIIKQFGKE